MDPIPVLTGEKIFLARVRREDAVTVAPFYSNLELTTYLNGWGRTYSLADEEAWFEMVSKNLPDMVFFGIFDRETRRIVGGTDLRQIDHRHGAAHFGISIHDPSLWGSGYGSEATRLMVAYGMYHLNLFNIALEVFAFNERAVAAYHKVGFREIGRRTGRVVLGGERFDQVLMEITRPEVDVSFLRDQLRLLADRQG